MGNKERSEYMLCVLAEAVRYELRAAKEYLESGDNNKALRAVNRALKGYPKEHLLSGDRK